MPSPTHRSPRYVTRGALAASFLLAFNASAQTPPAPSEPVVGPAPSGGTIVTTRQLVHAAGDTLEIPARPVDLVRSADGRFVYLKENKGITVVDATDWRVIQRLALGSDAASMTGLAFSADGTMLYVTDATTGLNGLAIGADGQLTKSRRIALPGPGGPKDNSFPCGVSMLGTTHALVCLSRNNSLAVVNMESGELEHEIPVGVAPFDVVVSPDRTRAYVSVWGGRLPEDNEPSADSAGTKARIDARGISASGGVRIVDLTANTPLAYIETGLSASALALSRDGSRLFVANSNHDTVTIIDSATAEVRQQLVVKPDAALPFGSMPSSVALSPDNRTLYVACAGNNAIACIDLVDQPAIRGWIPTDWYPGKIVATDTTLFIANIKGLGSRTPREDGNFNTHRHRGTAQRVQLPDAATLASMTAQVFRDGRVPEMLRASERTQLRQSLAPAPVPANPGEPSVFQHVLYILKENRTYDQVFGDMASGDTPKGNGRPDLCVFGREITPNQHALADEFVLLDNYYCNGVLSADGHSWATEGNVTPYLERSFGGFKRSYTYGDDPLTYSSSGFIWDHILAAGFSFRNFGEFNGAGITAPPGQGTKWVDVYKDWKSGTNAYRFPMNIGIDNLRRYSDPDAPGWNLEIPDQVRADHFIQELQRFEKSGDLPNFMILQLPNDHTAGVSEGAPTPRAYVADNDLAVGRVVEAVSQSKFWASTCIFVIEDDPQDGWDHVDGHRSTCLVISPYTKRGEVISKFYSQASVVQTIDRIFGLASVNQLTAASLLMSDCFASVPNFTPFIAKPANIPLDELSPPKPKKATPAKKPANPPEKKPGDGDAPPSQKKSGAAIAAPLPDLYAMTAKQDLSKPDRVNDDTFNRIIWHSMRGLDSPYPDHFAGAHGAGLTDLGLVLDDDADDDDE